MGGQDAVTCLFQMIEQFKILAGDENIVKEIDLSHPENIFKETVESIDATIGEKLKSAIPQGN
jgi:hypothetical protein